MINFDEAIAIICSAARPLGAERIALERAAWRVLASPVIGAIDSPRADVSAMDGYAVRGADLMALPVRLMTIGESFPGAAWPGTLEPGTCVRIFTGAQVPKGADRIVIQEQQMGLTPVQALENMVARCPSPAVESFTRAMMQGQVLGFSVGQILRTLAVEMRKRRRARAEQQAQKAPIKMLFPLILMIFPSLFVVLLGPALVSVFHALKG